MKLEHIFSIPESITKTTEGKLEQSKFEPDKNVKLIGND